MTLNPVQARRVTSTGQRICVATEGKKGDQMKIREWNLRFIRASPSTVSNVPVRLRFHRREILRVPLDCSPGRLTMDLGRENRSSILIRSPATDRQRNECKAVENVAVMRIQSLARVGFMFMNIAGPRISRCSSLKREN